MDHFLEMLKSPRFLIVLGLLAVVVYLLPTFIGFARGHRNALPILLVNFFLGWSLLGWVVAIAWALTDNSSGNADSIIEPRANENNTFKDQDLWTPARNFIILCVSVSIIAFFYYEDASGIAPLLAAACVVPVFIFELRECSICGKPRVIMRRAQLLKCQSCGVRYRQRWYDFSKMSDNERAEVQLRWAKQLEANGHNKGALHAYQWTCIYPGAPSYGAAKMGAERLKHFDS